MKNLLIGMVMAAIGCVLPFPQSAWADGSDNDITVELRVLRDTPAGDVQKLISGFADQKFKNAQLRLVQIEKGDNRAHVITNENAPFKLVQDVLKFLNSQQELKLGIALAQSPSAPRNSALTKPPGPRSAGTELKVFYLQSVDANQCVAVIKQVFATDVPSIAALDAETLVIRGSTDRLKEIESLLVALDRNPKRGTDLKPPPRSLPPNDLLNILDSIAKTPAGALGEQISLHRRLVADAEAKSLRLARHFREKGITDPGNAKSLVEEVQAAFEVRQKLSKLEIAHLLQRTQAMNEAVERRDSIAKEVVRRRAADLLNPELKWEPQDVDSSGVPMLPARKTTTSKKHSVVISGDSEKSVHDTEKILQEALNSVGSNLGPVDVQVANGNLIIRGAPQDVKKLEQAISRIEKRIQEDNDPIQAVLDLTHQFHELIRQGRIAEAAKHTLNRSLAIECSRIDDFAQQRIEEIAASRSTAIVVMAINPEFPKNPHLLLHCKRVRHADGASWKLSSIEYETDVRLAMKMDTFMQDHTDCKFTYLNEDGSRDSATIQIRFQRAPWKSVVDWLGKQMNADLKITEPERLKNDFSYQLESPISPQHAYRILRAEVRARGSDLLITRRGAEADPSLNTDDAIQGKIVQIAKGMLHLSIGLDDGIAKETTLDVRRDSEFVGTVEVGFVDPNASVARPSPGYKDTEFKVGDTVLLRHGVPAKDVPAKDAQEVQEALRTVNEYLKLVAEQRFAEAATLTQSDEQNAAGFLDIPNAKQCKIVELLNSGKAAIAISSKFKTDRGEAQLVFTLSGTVIEDIDLETADGVDKERQRFVEAYPQATRIHLQYGASQ